MAAPALGARLCSSLVVVCTVGWMARHRAIPCCSLVMIIMMMMILHSQHRSCRGRQIQFAISSVRMDGMPSFDSVPQFVPDDGCGGVDDSGRSGGRSVGQPTGHSTQPALLAVSEIDRSRAGAGSVAGEKKARIPPTNSPEPGSIVAHTVHTTPVPRRDSR